MEYSWQYWLFLSSLYVLGVIGFFAITLLPLRSWILLRRNSGFLSASTIGKFGYALVALAAISAIALSGASLVHVAKCLLGYHCSANRAGGWFLVASIGVWYLSFELFAFVVFRFLRRDYRVAT